MKAENNNIYTKNKIFIRIIISIIILATAIILRIRTSDYIAIDYEAAFNVIGNALSGETDFVTAIEDACIYAFGESDNDAKIES